MARYIGRVKGKANEATRLGYTKTGIRVEANGWNVGVKVCGNPADKDGKDVFTVYATGGSNGKCADKLIAVVREDGIGVPAERDLARAVVEWMTQRDAWGDPNRPDFVQMAQKILGETG